MRRGGRKGETDGIEAGVFKPSGQPQLMTPDSLGEKSRDPRGRIPVGAEGGKTRKRV